MNLSSPVSIEPPAIPLPDGSVRTFQPFTLTALDLTIMDSVSQRLCAVHIRAIPRPLILWTAEAYDAAGDYTQAQVEARVTELLGDNPKSVLEGLFQIVPPTVVPPSAPPAPNIGPTPPQPPLPAPQPEPAPEPEPETPTEN